MTDSSFSMSPGRRAHIQHDLLAWFDREHRDLPWRRSRHLYGTWISEIMLQQTTVKTVIPYYEKFLARFPDVGKLAAAPLEDVLSLWSGLGYYRRARNLHAAAKHVVEELGGKLPTDRAGWAALPGVGAYASGAIASMALGEVVPALDANAQRVLLRWMVDDPGEMDAWKPADRRRLGQDMVDPHRPGDWNEAVMELGALVCPAGPPRCGICPVRAHCRAGQSDRAESIGAAPAKVKSLNVVTAQLVVLWKERILLLAPGRGLVLSGPAGLVPIREDFGNLHHGLWSLPLTGWYDADSLVQDRWDTGSWGGQVAAHLGLDPDAVPGDFIPAGTCRHAITRYRIQSRTWVWRWPDTLAGPGGISFESHPGSEATKTVGDPGSWRFVGEGEGKTPVSSLVTKGLSAAGLTMG